MTDPIAELSFQLVKLFRGLRGLNTAIVEAGGLAVEASSLGLLAGLSTTGPTRLSSLAAVMCLDVSTVSRQVPALERQGWVARTRDPDDHRAQLVALTDDGRRTLEGIRRERAEVLARLLPDWSPDELRHFAEQLARFNDDIATHGPAAVPALTAQERA